MHYKLRKNSMSWKLYVLARNSESYRIDSFFFSRLKMVLVKAVKSYYVFGAIIGIKLLCSFCHLFLFFTEKANPVKHSQIRKQILF